jgi:hypothetical protein
MALAGGGRAGPPARALGCRSGEGQVLAGQVRHGALPGLVASACGSRKASRSVSWKNPSSGGGPGSPKIAARFLGGLGSRSGGLLTARPSRLYRLSTK